MQSVPGNNFMDLLKSQMMTMFMMKNIGQPGQPANTGISDSMYLLVITQFVDFVIKYLPIVANFLYTTYITNKLDKYKNKINTVVTQNNLVKVKKSSISLTIRVGDQDNVIGQTLMDYVTNCKNTAHVSYKNKNFMLNQKDVIEINHDIYAILTQSNEQSIDTQSNSQQLPTQILEIYSFEKTVDELRGFLETVKQNYILTQKNKLGNAKCYFDMVSKPALKVFSQLELIEKIILVCHNKWLSR